MKNRADIINALTRAAEALERQRDEIVANNPFDYSVEFPATDAELVRAAIAALNGTLDGVKRYTPNNIANEIMAEDAWHDSLWIREADHAAALAAKDAEIARLQTLAGERYAAKVRAEQEAAGLRNAVNAMHKFLDRDYAIVERDITLRCESHDQAWNYLHEMRDIVKAARAGGGE